MHQINSQAGIHPPVKFRKTDIRGYEAFVIESIRTLEVAHNALAGGLRFAAIWLSICDTRIFGMRDDRVHV
jgi:hypothetical protein